MKKAVRNAAVTLPRSQFGISFPQSQTNGEPITVLDATQHQ